MNKIIIVEDNQGWRGIISDVIENAGMEHQYCQPEEVKSVLNAGGVTTIISDGLRGKWKDIHALAVENNTGFVLVTGNEDFVTDAQKEKIPVFLKEKFFVRRMRAFLQSE